MNQYARLFGCPVSGNEESSGSGDEESSGSGRSAGDEKGAESAGAAGPGIPTIHMDF